jgi:putative DNA methylase
MSMTTSDRKENETTVTDHDGQTSALPLDNAFDTEFANQIAHLESFNKHHYRPNTYLHKWWARRCGTTFRLLLKALVGDESQRDFYVAGGLEGKVVLDPMMGGGTTLHEALRLGANVIGVDIDPIPILQAQATLSDVRLPDLEAAFTSLTRAVDEFAGSYFMTGCPECRQAVPLRFMLYGLQRYCQCGPAVFVDSLTLRHEKDGTTVRLCPVCHEVTCRDQPCGCQVAGPDKPPLLEKRVRHCSKCRASYREYLDRPYYARYVPLAAAGECPAHGFFLKSPNVSDLNLLAEADQQRPAADPAMAVQPGPKSIDLIRRGIANYQELYSSRQLLYLQEAARHLPSAEPQLRRYLALLVSTSLEFNAMLCGYKAAGKRRPGAIRHVFSHHAYSFPYTALENNPLYPAQASGTLQKLFHDRIRRARRWAERPRERLLAQSPLPGSKAAGHARPRSVTIRGEKDYGSEVSQPADLATGQRRFWLHQGSAAKLPLPDDSVDFVVTDPPYFDSVQYSDLAAFFRVWLQCMLPEAAEWTYDMAGSAVDPQANGRGQYSAIIEAIFAECHRVLKKGSGRLIFTFHHWNPKGWAAITIALQRAGFVLRSRYVVHSENPVSVHIANLRALTDDAILVLAPAGSGPATIWQRPKAIDTADSAQFCHDCATLLGWLLASDLSETAIGRVWDGMLGSDR